MVENELFSADILEDDFLSPFISHFYAQFILCSSRVIIKDRFATGPSTFGRIMTAIICAVVSITVYLTSDVYLEIYGQWPDLYKLCTFGIMMKIVLYICHAIKVRFFDENAAVEMLVYLQETDRVMNIDKTKLQEITRNGALIELTALLIIFALIVSGGFCDKRIYVQIPLLSTAWIILTFWLELCLCRIISLNFLTRMRYLNSILKTQLTPFETKQKEALTIGERLKSKLNPWSGNAMDKLVAENGHNFESSNADTQLRMLLKGFDLFRKAYQFQIMLQVFAGVVWMILSFEVLIIGFQQNLVEDNKHIFGFLIEFLLDSFRIAVISIHIEALFRELRITKKLLLVILSTLYEGPLWKKAKRMLSILEHTPPTFSVYDLFDVNAHFIVTLLSIGTAYLVTLLQIALL